MPYIYDEFFASGKEESISPFLTPRSRCWGKNVSLKAAFVAALFLAAAFAFSFFNIYLSYFFLSFVYFFAGTPALLGALEDLKNFEINIDVLMTFAALLSIVIGSELEGGLLLVLFELAGAMENLVSDKTKNALLHLNKLSPTFACLIDENGRSFKRAIAEVMISDRLLIKAGEIIPLDGIVREGASSINLAHLTGESHPVSKNVGDEVQAGALNLDGMLIVEVTRKSSDSTLSRIIALITQAQAAKPKLQRFIDRFGKSYAMTIMALSFIFALSLPFLFSLPFLGIEGSIYRGLAFLIAASPCALVLATPTAYLSALSAITKRGILLKGGAVLDAIASVRIVAFDKTGTLTTGKLLCTNIEALSPSPYTLDEALSIAYSLERSAVHPIADAISQKAQERGCSLVALSDFKAIAGSGLQATKVVNNEAVPVYIGHEAFVLSKCTFLPSIPKGKQGYLHCLLLIGTALYRFEFLDAIRQEAKDLIKRLKEEHAIHPIMLTGDTLSIARLVGSEVGIEEIHAHLTPQDKLEKVAAFSSQHGLMMIGDGINDAPALTRATVGISMGKIGSRTAVDASDAVFLHDELSLLDWLIAKSRKSMRVIKQNLTLALSVIFLATTPALFGFIPLWAAVLLHEGGTLLVGLNSLRLLKR